MRRDIPTVIPESSHKSMNVRRYPGDVDIDIRTGRGVSATLGAQEGAEMRHREAYDPALLSIDKALLDQPVPSG